MSKLSAILSNKTSNNPTIYAYEDTNPQYDGLLKVGYTSVNVLSRVNQQYPTQRPGPKPYKIVLEESAMLNTGSNFTDRDVHTLLRQMKIPNPKGEWFECSVKEVKNAILQLRSGEKFSLHRTQDFTMRPEQKKRLRKPNSTLDLLRTKRVKFQRCYGMLKCVLEKHLQPTS